MPRKSELCCAAEAAGHLVVDCLLQSEPLLSMFCSIFERPSGSDSVVMGGTLIFKLSPPTLLFSTKLSYRRPYIRSWRWFFAEGEIMLLTVRGWGHF